MWRAEVLFSSSCLQGVGCEKVCLTFKHKIDPHWFSGTHTAGDALAGVGAHVISSDGVTILPITGKVVGGEEFLLEDLALDAEDNGCLRSCVATDGPPGRVVSGAYFHSTERCEACFSDRQSPSG